MKNTFKVISITLCLLAVVSVVAFAQSGGQSALVGKWIPESGGKAPTGLPDDLELFKDGTGIMEGFSISWKVENKRFVISLLSSSRATVYNYEISGSKLILTHDNGRNETYVKNEVNAQSSNRNGEFILIDIPAKYNDKYAYLIGRDSRHGDGFELYGGDSRDTRKLFRIIDRKVIIPLYFVRINDDGNIIGKIERYSGNHHREVTLGICDSADWKVGSPVLEYVGFDDNSNGDYIDPRDNRVRFTNGSAIKSYNNRTIRNPKW